MMPRSMVAPGTALFSILRPMDGRRCSKSASCGEYDVLSLRKGYWE